MHISQLTLSHFRSHKFTQVPVGNGPIALFGSNGAGKTNILEGISLLSPGKGNIEINGVQLEEYVPRESLATVIKQPFSVLEKNKDFDVLIG